MKYDLPPLDQIDKAALLPDAFQALLSEKPEVVLTAEFDNVDGPRILGILGYNV